MKVFLSRDSVVAGDDIKSHDTTMEMEVKDALDLIGRVVAARYLASIHGGRATWVAVSHRPLAVCAQQWPYPRLIFWRPIPCSELLCAPGGVRLHFSYLAQIDPEIVQQALQRTAHTADDR